MSKIRKLSKKLDKTNLSVSLSIKSVGYKIIDTI